MSSLPCITLCAMLLGAASQSLAQSMTAKDNVDKLIDWEDPWSLTPEAFMQKMAAMGQGQPQPLYAVRSDAFGASHYEMTLDGNPGFKFQMMGGMVQPQDFVCTFKGSQLMRISFHLGKEGAAADPQQVKLVTDHISQMAGGGRPMAYREAYSGVIRKTGLEWVHAKYVVRMFDLFRSEAAGYQPSGTYAIELYHWGSKSPYEVLPYSKRTPPPPRPKLEADLDSLLNFSQLWRWTPEDLEKAYSAKAASEAEQQRPPQFEWLSASKDRARFSRHMFGDVETKLTMFGGSINVEEAVVEFVSGRAARATVSFYNRGDAGEIKLADFERIFKTVGQNLGKVTKVAPRRQIFSSNAALPVAGWMWTAAAGIALLEHNEYNKPGIMAQPEFLRLKLAAPNQADWSMGRLAVGVQRMELLQRVTKAAGGDVYISGVPMVDQGQKGYCVAASCQRLFEYMRIPCDQHEMARLVSIDAETGANIMTMQKSLAKIDGAFKVAFKPLVNPEQYYSASRKRRVSEREFVSLVKEYTDKGIPLLWGLVLGERPENPPLPNGGQVSGGHMRLVIGYNAAKNQLLFTDSWGAGHELKRMSMLDAYDVTLGLYSMAPRGL